MDKKINKLNLCVNEYLDQVERDIDFYKSKLSEDLESSSYMYYTGLLEVSMREYGHLSRLKEVME